MSRIGVNARSAHTKLGSIPHEQNRSEGEWESNSLNSCKTVRGIQRSACSNLSFKRFATSTGGFCIRVVKLETGPIDAVDVVDFCPGQIEKRPCVHKNPETIHIHDFIIDSRFFI